MNELWRLSLIFISTCIFHLAASQTNERGSRGFTGSHQTNSGFEVNQPLGGYCPPDTVALINQENGIAQGCPGNQTCSEVDYECRLSTTHQHLCCGREGQCPLGYAKYFDPASRRPIPCAEQQTNGCPSGTKCLRSQLGAEEQFLCCSIAPHLGSNPSDPSETHANQPWGQPGEAGDIEGLETLNIGQAGPFRKTESGFISAVEHFPEALSSIDSTSLSMLRHHKQTQQQQLEDPVVFCTKGGQAYREGSRVKMCNPIIAMCPTDHKCERAQNFPGLNVCCPLDSTIVTFEMTSPQPKPMSTPSPIPESIVFPECPSGTSPEMFLNGVVRRCNTLDPLSCSTAHACLPAPNAHGVHVCCGNLDRYRSSDRPGFCKGLREPFSLDPCVLGRAFATLCPQGSICLPTSNEVAGCCPTVSLEEMESSVTTAAPSTTTTTSEATTTTTTTTRRTSRQPETECVNDQLPEMFSGKPRSCTPDRRICRQGYECLPRKKGSGYICCRGPRCPGGITVGGGVDGLPLRCSVGAADQCAFGQICVRSANNPYVSICCPSSAAAAAAKLS